MGKFRLYGRAVLSGQGMAIRLPQGTYKVPPSGFSRVSKLAIGGEDEESLGQRHIESDMQVDLCEV